MEWVRKSLSPQPQVHCAWAVWMCEWACFEAAQAVAEQVGEPQ